MREYKEGSEHINTLDQLLLYLNEGARELHYLLIDGYFFVGLHHHAGRHVSIESPPATVAREDNRRTSYVIL